MYDSGLLDGGGGGGVMMMPPPPQQQQQPPTALQTHHGAPIHDAQLDFYSKLLATCSGDHTVKVFDVATTRLVAELRGHDGPVWRVGWAHPRFGVVLASAGHDRRVIVWRQGAGEQFEPIYVDTEYQTSVNALSVAPGHNLLEIATGSADGQLTVLSYDHMQGIWNRKSVAGHPHGILAVCWGPAAAAAGGGSDAAIGGSGSKSAGRPRIGTGGCDGRVRIWSCLEATGEWVETAAGPVGNHDGWVRDVAWRTCSGGGSGGGRGQNIIASASDDGTVKLWHESENSPWKLKQTLNIGSPVWSVSWSITGSTLAIATADGTVTHFRENSDGSFTAPPEPSTGGSSSSVASAAAAGADQL